MGVAVAAILNVGVVASVGADIYTPKDGEQDGSVPNDWVKPTKKPQGDRAAPEKVVKGGCARRDGMPEWALGAAMLVLGAVGLRRSRPRVTLA